MRRLRAIDFAGAFHDPCDGAVRRRQGRGPGASAEGELARRGATFPCCTGQALRTHAAKLTGRRHRPDRRADCGHGRPHCGAAEDRQHAALHRRDDDAGAGPWTRQDRTIVGHWAKDNGGTGYPLAMLRGDRGWGSPLPHGVALHDRPGRSGDYAEKILGPTVPIPDMTVLRCGSSRTRPCTVVPSGGRLPHQGPDDAGQKNKAESGLLRGVWNRGVIGESGRFMGWR